MEWVVFSGSWRRTNAEVERDVRLGVREVMNLGRGIISGGALGVDYFATDEALKIDPTAERIKVIIPSSYEVYVEHFSRRADEGVITQRQANELIGLTAQIKLVNPGSLIEMGHTALNEESYYDRNTKELESAVELRAFHVNGSLGTKDTIDKAVALGLSVVVKEYSIP